MTFCRERKWGYSVSVTHPGCKAPVLEQLEGLPESVWEDIGLCEKATLVRHRPQGWVEHPYVVVRKFIGKQGQENAFKGPLRDLDLHHPPCRKLLANQAFYACEQLTRMPLCALQFNLLLPKPARKHGLRPLIRHFIRTVVRLVHAAGRWHLDFAKSNLRLDWIYSAAVQLE